MPKLQVSDQNGEKSYELGDRIYVLGRASNNEIQVKDQVASRRHCQIEMTKERRFQLTDLESSNGTHVNGEAIAAAYLLVDGDEISIGDARIRFEDPDNPRPRTAPARKATSRKGKHGAARPAKAKAASAAPNGDGDDDDFDDRSKTTRRGRRGRARASSGSSGGVIAGVVIVGIILVFVVGPKLFTGPEIDQNARYYALAEEAYKNGKFAQAEANLEKIRGPEGDLAQKKADLEGKIDRRKKESRAEENFLRIQPLAEASRKDLDEKIDKLKNFRDLFADTSFGEKASQEIERLEDLRRRGGGGQQEDPFEVARREAQGHLNRREFAAAEKVWNDYRQANMLHGDRAIEQIEQVRAKAEEEYQSMVERARSLKSGGDTEAGRALLDLIITNFGPDYAARARRLREGEFQ